MPRNERYLVGLDVGTTKVAAIVGEVTDDGGVEIIGIGTADAKGIRRGAVVNLEEAVESIKKAIEEAELTAGIEIDSVYLTLSGAHIKGFNSRGVVAVSGKTREITREDVRRAIDAAKAFALPNGREILHVLPQDFAVDDEEGIADPVGMTGSRLDVNVHIVTGGAASMQNLIACVNRAGVNVVDTVLEQIAAAEAVLTPDERELGVAVVDIGGGTTDFAIFERGSLWHTGVVAIGGDHFANDIAVGFASPVPDAEKLKRRCGFALDSMVGVEDGTIEVASVGGRRRAWCRGASFRGSSPHAEQGFPHAVGRDEQAGCRPTRCTRGSFDRRGYRPSTAWPKWAEADLDLRSVVARRQVKTGDRPAAPSTRRPSVPVIYAAGAGLQHHPGVDRRRWVSIGELHVQRLLHRAMTRRARRRGTHARR